MIRSHFLRHLLVGTLVNTAAWLLHAQATTPMRVAFDSAGVSDTLLSIGRMPPGWHVTHKTAIGSGVAFNAADTVSGTFTVSTEFYLFSSQAGNGAGVMFTTSPVDKGTLAYVAFQVGPDGTYRVVRHTSRGTETLVPWTANAAITKHPGGQNDVKETVSIVADGANVRFSVNGTLVHTLPRNALPARAVAGLRIDPMVSAHVTSLVLNGRNVAPVKS